MADQYEARISNTLGSTSNFDDDMENDTDFLFNNPSRGANNTMGSVRNGDFLFEDEEDDEDEEDMLALYNLSPRQRMFYKLKHLILTKNIKRFKKLSQWQKVLVIVCLFTFCSLAFTFLVLHKQILAYVVETSNELHDKWSTKYILFVLLYIVAFPPMIGYSLLATSAGMIYGVTLKGWLILASGTVLGSISSFYVFQKFLNSQAEKLVHANRKFEAIAAVLQENNSYIILALVRLCPFPYSLTNGALAGIYGIRFKNFVIANIIVSPKLFMYLFIGSRLKNLGENNNHNKTFDVLSIIFALLALSATATVLYSKTKKKYRELQSDIYV